MSAGKRASVPFYYMFGYLKDLANKRSIIEVLAGKNSLWIPDFFIPAFEQRSENVQMMSEFFPFSDDRIPPED